MNVNAPVEDTARFVVEYAVEIFMAGAVGLGVLHDHVMIGQLFAMCQVKTIEDALQALTRKPGSDVVPRELRAERE